MLRVLLFGVALAVFGTLGATVSLAQGTSPQPGVSHLEGELVGPAVAIPILEARTLSASPLSLEAAPGAARSSAVQSFGSAGIGAPAGAEITELARALRYDVDLIFEYVRDQIEFEFTFGAMRGPVGTLLDGRGNSFDQANLMVELLRASGYTASYVLGVRRLLANDLTEIFDVNLAFDPVANLVADGGSPVEITTDDGTVNGTVTQVDLTMVWVKVNIGGTDYVFDPSLVPQIFTAGIDIASITGYDRTAFLSNALVGATQTSDYIQNVNRANIRSDLEGHANNLISHIKTNIPAAELEEIIGGSQPQPLAGPVRDSSIPNQQSILQEWTGDIPATYHTLLRIEMPGIDHTFESREIYGESLAVSYDGSNQPVLSLTGNPVVVGTSGIPGETQTMTFSIDHPFAAFGGTYGDREGIDSSVRVGGTAFIANSWGLSGRGLYEKHRKRLSEYRYQGFADSSVEVLGEALAMIGESWLAQTSRGVEVANQLYRARMLYIHRLGVVSQGDGVSLDFPLNTVIGTSLDETGGTNVIHDAVFYALSDRASAQEHVAIEQNQPYAAISTVKGFDLAMSDGEKIFDTTSANFSAVQSQLVGYSASDLADIQAGIGAGHRYLLPEVGDRTIDSWTGAVKLVLRIDGSIGHLIGGELKGGYSTALGPVEVSSAEAVAQIPNLDLGSPTKADPINFRTGEFLSTAQDMTVGSGPLPLGLSLERSYNSGDRLEDRGVGLGWTHSFDITAMSDSNGFQALGEDSAIDAAAAIVAIYVGADIVMDNRDKDRLVVSALVDNWFADRMLQNAVALRQPGQGGIFMALPDGTFSPPPGNAADMTDNGDGTYNLRTPEGISVDFNTDGKVSLWQDPNGNQLTFGYSVDGERLETVSNSFGRTLTFSYNAGDRVANVSDGTGRSVIYGYDPAGNLTSFTDAEGHAVTYDYDIDGRMTNIFFPAFPTTATVTNVYDTLDRVMEQTNSEGGLYQYFFAGSRSEELDPDGQSTVSYFDGQGNVTRDVDQLGNETVNDYDGLDRLVERSLPEGNRVAFEYDDKHNVTKITHHPKPASIEPPLVRSFVYGTAFNRLTSQTDALMRVTDYIYDPEGNLDRVEFPQVDGVTPIRSFTYNAAGQVETNTDPEGLVTRFSYNPPSGGDLQTISVDDGGLNLITFLGYDPVGNIDSRTDAWQRTTTFNFDDERRLILATVPAPFSFQTKSIYFLDGKLQRVERQTDDPLNPWQITSFTYRASGERESATDAEGDTTTFLYDQMQRVEAVVDGELRRLESEYDAAGRVFRVYRNVGGAMVQVEEHLYTDNGRKLSVMDARGDVTQFGYDGFDRLETTTFADSTFEQLTYDAVGNLRERLNRAGEQILFTYDPLDRLDTKTLPGPRLFDYGYDLAGRLETAVAPEGTLTNLYDTAGRLSVATDATGRGLAYGYDLNSNRARLDYPDGFFVTYEYDELNRLKTIKEAGTTALVSYGYDPLSRLTSVTYANGAAMAYGYELDDDLARVAQSFAGSSVTFDYEYNGAGQKISQAVSDDAYLWRPANATTIGYVPATLNIYDSVRGVSFGYDLKGNLTSDGVETYGYDAENRLTGAAAAGATYTYDPFGRRTETVVGSVTTRFLYDGDNVVGEYDAAGVLTARYVQGPGLDAPVLMERGGARHWYHFDGTGSVVALSDASGVAAERYAYSPYGESIDTSPAGNPYRFTARRLDAETGLYHYRARAYSAALGRFLQPDPAGFVDGLNLYAYVGNDPLNFVDPLGLARGEVGLIGSALDLLGSLGNTLLGTANLIASPINNAIVFSVDSCQACFDPGLYASAQGIPFIGQAGTLASGAARGVQAYAGIVRGTSRLPTVQLSRVRFPESAQHIDDAVAAGQPRTLTIDRAGAAARRREALRGTHRSPGLDRDEFPPAMFQEGGQGASFRLIRPSDNRGAGACIGAQCGTLPDGTRILLETVD